MKNKTKAPTGAKCASVNNGAPCALAGDHAVHSTTADAKKVAQHRTWQLVDNGKIRVVTFSRGKKMSEWTEDAPPAPGRIENGSAPVGGAAARRKTCESKRFGVEACILPDGHNGAHISIGENSGRVNTWTGASDEMNCWHPCGANGICIRPEEHDGEHRALPAPGLTDVVAMLLEQDDVAAVFAPNKNPDPSLADACPKCGFELGHHTGKKCPKVVKPARQKHDNSEPTATQAEAVPGKLLICGYPRHPAAALFDLLEGAPLTALADSIEKNGQRDRIVRVTVGGRTYILDGSNRGLACEMRKIKPQFVDYEGPKDMASLVAYSIDKNKHRRHLEPSQLAMIASDAAQLGQGNPGDRETGRPNGLMTQAEAGAALGVSETLVRRAKVVQSKGTAKVNEAVRKGKLAVDAAVDLVKLPAKKQDEIAEEALAKKGGAVRTGHVRALVRQEERRSVVSNINTGKVAPISSLPGGFGVLLWDPPWEYQNSDDHPSARGHIKYPPMTLEQLVDLGRDALAKLRDDAVIVTWATNPRMPVAVHLIEALGLTWQSMGTWVKERIGMGPTNMRSRTEHYIVATRGEPTHTLNELSTWLGDRPLPQTEHSAKPTELHDELERHCSGPFLELFARGPRDKWTTWGAEAEKFATEAA